MRDTTVESVLEFDAIATSEVVLGKTGPDRRDDDVTMLGMLFAHENARSKEAILKEIGDSHYRMTVEQMFEVLHGLGMEQVLCEDIIPTETYHTEGDKYYVFAGAGLLAAFDTYYNHKTVNSGNVYYNWKPTGGTAADVWGGDNGRLTSSGSCHFEGDDFIAWVGGHDIREGIAYRINRLRECGEILPKWAKSPRPWLVHYGERPEEKGFNGEFYDRVIRERIKRLPQWVQDMIGEDR